MAELSASRRLQAEARLRDLRVTFAQLFPGREIRDDSRLAGQFVTETGDGRELSAMAVADMMGTMQILFERSTYGSDVQRDMRAVANWAHRLWPDVEWDVIWRAVRQTVPPASQIEAWSRLRA